MHFGNIFVLPGQIDAIKNNWNSLGEKCKHLSANGKCRMQFLNLICLADMFDQHKLEQFVRYMKSALD